MYRRALFFGLLLLSLGLSVAFYLLSLPFFFVVFVLPLIPLFHPRRQGPA